MPSGCCSRDCKHKIVMVRHGESEWNAQNLFCGWVDVGLSAKGEQEAINAGQAIKNAGYKFDIAYTSLLSRAHQTLNTILKEIDQMGVRIVQTWRLNERHYGGLTGLNKAETADKYGEEQVKLWRRSYDVPPPPMEEDHPYYKQIIEDLRYANGPTAEEFPKFESLELTINRTLPFWNETIVPKINACKRILIVAHGNSLRGIVKHLDKINIEDIINLNLPTGIPFVYTLDKNMNPVPDGSMRFLGHPETVKEAMESVADQGKASK